MSWSASSRLRFRVTLLAGNHVIYNTEMVPLLGDARAAESSRGEPAADRGRAGIVVKSPTETSI